MADNVAEVLKNLMQNVDKQKLQSTLPQFMQLLSTPDGRVLLDKIKTADQNKLASMIQQINLDSAAGQINNAEVLLGRASQDPNYIKNLISMLS